MSPITLASGTSNTLLTLNVASAAILIFTLLAATVVDWRERRIPTRLVKPASALSLIAFALPGQESIRLAVIGGASFWAILRLVHELRPAGLGMGDVRLAGFIGLHLGATALGPAHLGWRLGATLATASSLGIALAVWFHFVEPGAPEECDGQKPMQPDKRHRRLVATEVPFGPALSMATLLVLIS